MERVVGVGGYGRAEWVVGRSGDDKAEWNGMGR